eukprot:s391_g11.t1
MKRVNSEPHVASKKIVLDSNAKPWEQFQALRELKGLTAPVLRGLLAQLREDGKGRGACKRPRLKFAKIHDLVTTVSFGSPVSHMAVTLLPALLQAKCDESPCFRDMMQHVLETKGPQLELVLAWDEAVPGNVLQPDLRRKAAMTYGAISQMPALWADENWMTLALVRTQDLQCTEHGYPLSLVHYLRWLREQVARAARH